MATPGVQTRSFFNIGVETTAGTAVAATKRLLPDGTGMWDLDRNRVFHGGNRGTTIKRTHSTQTQVTLDIPYQSHGDVGAAYDELVIPFSQLQGGETGVVGTADYTWAFAPPANADLAPDTYTIEWGDNIQAYEADYCFAESFRIAAAETGLTDLEIGFVGRASDKATATSLTADNDVRIPGSTWRLKVEDTQAAISGGTYYANLLKSFDLEVLLPHRRGFYQDGSLEFGQLEESMELDATLELRLASTADAVTELYDAAAAETVKFIYLENTGPTLGGSNYMVGITLAVLFEDPEVIGEETEGVNIYRATGHLVYDATWAQGLTADLVCSIGALP